MILVNRQQVSDQLLIVAMKKAVKKLSVHTYDADHAFANPSNPKHDVAATADAHKRTIAFLKREMQLF